MKRWFGLLIVMFLVGCAPSTKPPSVVPSSPAPPSEVDQKNALAPVKEPPVVAGSGAPAMPKVAAIVVTGPKGEKRFAADSLNLALNVSGPLRLRVEVTEPSPKGWAEWYFEGIYNPQPGRQPKDARRLVSLGGGYELEWNPGAGTEGKLWVSVWGDGGRAGRPGWRSWDIYPMYPWPSTTQCPVVTLTPQPAREGGTQTIVSTTMNQLTIDWYGETFLIPLSANPDTCADAGVASRLREAKSR